jgi:hypothetical protein
MTASVPPAEGPGPPAGRSRSAFWGRSRTAPERDRSRLFSVLVVAALIAVVASTLVQAWVVFVVVPQQIRNSEPVVIDQAVLLSDGPYVGCFDLVSAPGALVIHHGESFVLSWTIAAPANVSPSCTVQSIDANLGPAEVTGSNLPLTILAGEVGYVQVEFAPLNFPYWGGVTVAVTETHP